MKRLSTQNAILVAGALVAVGIGGGLAIGLRRSSPSEVKQSESDLPRSQTVSPAPPAASTAPTPSPKGIARGNAGQDNGASDGAHAPANIDARTRTVSADAARALGTQLPTLRARCWEPARAKSAGPARVTLILNYTFGADGKQLARGISDVPGASRPDVTRCVASAVAPIEVAPPGDRTYVEIPITLP